MRKSADNLGADQLQLQLFHGQGVSYCNLLGVVLNRISATLPCQGKSGRHIALIRAYPHSRLSNKPGFEKKIEMILSNARVCSKMFAGLLNRNIISRIEEELDNVSRIIIEVIFVALLLCELCMKVRVLRCEFLDLSAQTRILRCKLRILFFLFFKNAELKENFFKMSSLRCRNRILSDKVLDSGTDRHSMCIFLC